MAAATHNSPFSAHQQRIGLAVAGLATLLIVVFDIWAVPDLPLGYLYLFPIVLAGGFLSRWQAALLAVFFALLATKGWEVSASSIVTVCGFVVAGLFAAQLGRNSRRLERQLEELETQNRLRQEAEEELRALIETSAAAIITVDADGKIRQSNQSAERVLGAGGSLQGHQIAVYLPFLGGVLKRASDANSFRTMAEGRGRRRDGAAFFAQVWFSTYHTSSGPRLAAIIWDASEQLREREELGLRQLLSSSRIFMGAMSHEVRNLCAAISVVHLNLAKKPEFAGNPDFQALGNLVEGLQQLASSELRSAATEDHHGTDLRELLEELSIIAGPPAEEAGVQMEWEIPETLPLIKADRAALLQVLLNLVNNAVRAVQKQQPPLISVVAYALRESVVVRVCNRGAAMQAPQDLFQPFQPGATSSGLGLYVSRAIVRTFGGELRYVAEPGGHCFLVELKPEVPGSAGN